MADWESSSRIAASASAEPTVRGRFPRMERYIQALPDGLASYPRCTTKASIYRMLLDRLPEPMDVSGLPAEIAALIATPQPSGSWIETAKVNAVELAVADWVGSDAKFVALAEEMNNALLRSPMYRALVFVASPAFLIRTAARAWGQFHRGVPARDRDDVVEADGTQADDNCHDRKPKAEPGPADLPARRYRLGSQTSANQPSGPCPDSAAVSCWAPLRAARTRSACEARVWS